MKLFSILFLFATLAHCPTYNPLPSIVEVAMNDIGVRECSKRADEMMKRCGYRSSKEPWCAAAVSSWLSESGYEMRIVSVSQMKDAFKGLRKVPPATGTIVFFKHSHVGIVKEAKKDCVITIEGNVNNRVMLVARNYSSISYCVKPEIMYHESIE